MSRSFPHMDRAGRVGVSCSTFIIAYAYFLNIFLSTQKKIKPPIKLATTVAQNSPREDSQHKQIANTGVDNCQRNKYNKYFFIKLR